MRLNHALLAAVAVVVVTGRAHADTKSQFYSVDQSASVTAGGNVRIDAYCNNSSDIIVGGGCWGSDTMITWESYPWLNQGSTDYYSCAISDSVAHTVYATALCKTPGTDSKTNYYERTADVGLGYPGHSAGQYNATAYCDNTSDPVVSGGVNVLYGPLGGFPGPGFTAIVGQVQFPSGGSKDHWYAIEYYDGESADTMTVGVICKSGGSKSNYQSVTASTTWTSGPANPTKVEAFCGSSSYKILIGGCWGTGVNYINAAVTHPNGATGTDSFRCNVAPNSSGEAAATALCQIN